MQSSLKRIHYYSSLLQYAAGLDGGKVHEAHQGEGIGTGHVG